jgi:hypothetical protein
MLNDRRRNRGLLIATVMAGFAFATAPCGAVHLIKPKDLQTPAQPSCVNLTGSLFFTQKIGLFKVLSTARLERGPYLSEKSDGRGTFYRAPPGGIRINGNESATDGNGRTYDGGFYVPDDPTEPVRMYLYGSMLPAAVEAPTAEANCSTAGYVKEPDTQKLSLVAAGTGGLIGGAAGGTAARSMSPASNTSYGRAAAAGAGGGALGFIIVAAIANADVGKIYFPDSPQPDADMISKLRTLCAQKVVLKEVPAEQVAPPEPH